MSSRKRPTRRRFLQQTMTAAGSAFFLTRGTRGTLQEAPIYLRDHDWLIGCWTRPWADQDYRVAMDAVAEAGFRYIALTGAKTSTRRVIAPATTLEESRMVGEEAGKRGLSITNAYGGGIPLTDGGEALRKMIDNASAAEAWSVLLSHVGEEETFEECCRTISECCDYAKEKGLTIVLKPHGGTTGTGPELRRAVERVARDNFTVMYDPGNILYYSDGKVDPVEDCSALDGLVTGVSIKDYRHPKEVMLTPGTGEVDFPALMSRLRKGGFTGGPLPIECLTLGDAQQTLEEAKRARVFVEQLVGNGA